LRHSEPGSARYDDWRQVSGYFDGDGCVIARIRQLVVILYLRRTECCTEQLEQVEILLLSTEEMPARIYRDAVLAAYHLMVSRQDSVVKIAQKLLLYTLKKRVELQVGLDYYADKITGNEAVALLNEQIERGFRSANQLSASLPLTHTEAVRRARRRSNLTDDQVDAMRMAYANGGSVPELALSYGRAPSTIGKIATSHAQD
jgi:hypothetical protein